jgi:hypothetical protein
MEEIAKEMAWDRACWDEGMAVARHAREIHDLANERCHRQPMADLAHHCMRGQKSLHRSLRGLT